MRTFNFQIALLALAVGAGPKAAAQPAPPATAENKQERLDGYGDPLPTGALFRLGTVRLEDDPGNEVHRFDARCEAAAAELRKALIQSVEIQIFSRKAAAERVFEQNVSWCQECCLGHLR